MDRVGTSTPGRGALHKDKGYLPPLGKPNDWVTPLGGVLSPYTLQMATPGSVQELLCRPGILWSDTHPTLPGRSDVEAGGTTFFPRSSGFPRQRALEACVAGSNNHPAAPPRSPSSAAGQVAEHAQQQEGAGGREPPGLHIIPRQGRAVMFW